MRTQNGHRDRKSELDDLALTAIGFERRMAKSFATGAIPFQVHDAARKERYRDYLL